MLVEILESRSECGPKGKTFEVNDAKANEWIKKGLAKKATQKAEPKPKPKPKRKH